jgi:hypothetical protein
MTAVVVKMTNPGTGQDETVEGMANAGQTINDLVFRGADYRQIFDQTFAALTANGAHGFFVENANHTLEPLVKENGPNKYSYGSGANEKFNIKPELDESGGLTNGVKKMTFTVPEPTEQGGARRNMLASGYVLAIAQGCMTILNVKNPTTGQLTQLKQFLLAHIFLSRCH